MKVETMKTIKLKDIKTPSTVEEFRTNLKKYFFCNHKDNTVWIKTHNQPMHEVKIDEIENMGDLYSKMKTHQISFIPMIDVDINEITNEEIMQNMFARDFSKVLSDESRFTFYELNSNEEQREYIDRENANWYDLSNQILRYFYAKSLGKFSGYLFEEIKEVA